MEREDRKMLRKLQREQILKDEKEDFWRLLQKSQLIDSSEEESDADDERSRDDDDAGLTMRSDFIRASKNIERMTKKRCCVECGTCYCYSGGKLILHYLLLTRICNCSVFMLTGSTFTDQEAKAIARSRHPSGNPIAAGSQLTGGKNEWMFTSTLTPKLTLKTEQQRWVWDLAFSADSQYIFTGK